MRIFRLIGSAFETQRQYFTLDREDIAHENIITMQIAGLVGSVVSCVFFVIAPIIIPSWSITAEYYFVVPILAAAFLFAFVCKRLGTRVKPLAVEIGSALFYVLLLADFIALSVFPYPNTPQIFISLCFMFMPVLLIQRPVVLLGVMGVSEVVFVVLAASFKTPFALENDIFNTVAALFFSMVAMGTTNRLRCRNHSVRMTLEALSRTDALTGLLNKNAFEERCAAALARLDEGRGCALMVLDLDDFKGVNDSRGHPFGDALLEAVGGVLRRSFRQSDLVGRVGGDEFAVMLFGSTEPAPLEHKCELLRSRFDSISVEGVELHPTCSIGVATARGRTTYAELFRTADEALYSVKRNNKGMASII